MGKGTQSTGNIESSRCNSSQLVLCDSLHQRFHENEKSWKDISEFCGIKSKKKMTKVLNRDSQRGAFLSQGVLSSAGKVNTNIEQSKKEIENFLLSFDISPSGEISTEL